MKLFVQGAQALAGTIHGKKSTLLFTCKLIVYYGLDTLHLVVNILCRLTNNVINFLRSCCPPAWISCNQFRFELSAGTFSWRFVWPSQISTYQFIQLFRQQHLNRGWNPQQPHRKHCGPVQNEELFLSFPRERSEVKERVHLPQAAGV